MYTCYIIHQTIETRWHIFLIKPDHNQLDFWLFACLMSIHDLTQSVDTKLNEIWMNQNTRRVFHENAMTNVGFLHILFSPTQYVDLSAFHFTGKCLR